MFYTIIVSVAISLLIIITLHYLFLFFKETLTFPIVKDLIVQPTQTYKYLETISSSNNTTRVDSLLTSNVEPVDSNAMKVELTHYLNDLNDIKYSANNLNNTTTMNTINTINNLDTQLTTKLYNEIR